MMSRPCGSSGPSTRLGGAGTRGASAQMAGLARALCVLAVCGHARASSPGVNATNATCPTKLSEQQQRPFAKVFFDQGCVAVMAPRSDGTCPIETLDTFTARYFGTLCIEAVALAYVAIFTNVCSVQLGGIPCPRAPDERGTRGELSVIGTMMWSQYMFLGLGQIVAQLLSIVMVVAAFAKAREDFSPCLQPWAHGMDLLGVVALPTFAFTPVVQVPMILIGVSWAVLIEGAKVYCASRRITTFHVEHLANIYIVVFMGFPYLFSLIAFFLSGSVFFGTCLFFPIFALVGPALYGILMLLRVVATKVMASESELAAVKNLQGMLW